MSQLFISLYLDEDVDVLVARLLGAYGFDAHTTRDAGNLHYTDAQQLAFATQAGRALLTHNRLDFERLAAEYFASGERHAGILIAVRRPPRQIVGRLLTILNYVSADEMQDQIRYL